ncbi:MAG: choice-of-anchor tandem repeat GloVer-containing protein [Bacteroidota bacterium]
MKTITKFFILFFLLSCLNIHLSAQTKLWNVLPNSGNTESGVVYEINLDGSGFNTVHEFKRVNCEMPRGKLLHADNGLFYGIAKGGFGSFGSVIFEYNAETGAFEFAHDFFDPETQQSVDAGSCSLIQHSNGKVYGLTQHGGDYGDGQLFEFDLATRSMVIKVHFETASKGETPLGHLTEAGDGKLYGVAFEGGMHGLGVLYVYDPVANIFAVLKHFNGSSWGSNPIDGPMQASNGKLYGMTRAGGTSDLGVVYEYAIATNQITKIHDFNGTSTGSGPEGKFCQASNGILYGMTAQGGNSDKGTIIEYDISAGVVTKKFDFNGTNGRYPSGGFIEYADGLLYGLTADGGIQDRGVLLSLDPATGNVTKLQDLYDEYGEVAHTTLTEGPDGKLFGVTMWGGIYPTSGVLFDYHPPTGIYTKRIDFRYGENGARPYSPLIKASDGYVYGTTLDAGELFSGSIFRIDPTDMSFESVFYFDYMNTGGGIYSGGMIQADNGLLYGTTDNGGSNFSGVLYVFDPVSFSYIVLHHFEEASTGKYPGGQLLQASNGKLYGVTNRGGVNSDGVLFEYDMNNSTLTKLLDFDENVSGKYPRGLMQAANGMIYGITDIGGSFSSGVLFEYDPDTYSYEVKVHFDGTNKGSYPLGVPLEYEDNQLYGTTAYGGTNMAGVLYHYDAITETYTKLLNFDGINTGSNPKNHLIKASDDMIYGTTVSGGQHDFGVMFSYDPVMNNYNTVYEYTSYGDKPETSAFLEVETDYGIGEDNVNDLQLSIFPNPAGQYVNITLPVNTEADIRIVNMLGQIKMETSVITDNNSMIQLNVSSIEAGMYFFQLTNQEYSVTLKFVKTK